MGAKLHRVHFPGVGEGIVHIPGGCPYQYDDEEKFDIGSYVRFGNKGFIYSLSAGITNLQKGVKNSARQPVLWSAIAATVAAGVKQVTVDLAAGAGPLADGNILLDALKGGEICIMPTWGTGFTRHITGNSAVATGAGGEFTVDFDSPTPILLTVDVAHAECISSPYNGVVGNGIGDAGAPVLGMPTLITPDGKYCWIQVEGPFGIAAQGTVGHTTDNLQAVFRGDGSIDPHAAGGLQHAGVIMALSLVHAQGTPFINLQIAH